MQFSAPHRALLIAAAMLTCLATLGVPASPARAACTVNVPYGDVLWIRSGPGTQYSRIGSIPRDACGVAVFGECQGRWRQVEYRGVSGWAHTGFLDSGCGYATPVPPPPQPVYPPAGRSEAYYQRCNKLRDLCYDAGSQWGCRELRKAGCP